MINPKDRKNYKSFGNYLSRNGFSKGNCLASLFIEKFALSNKASEYKTITMEDLKERKILPCEKHRTFSHWRTEMIKNGIIICMATKEELEESSPNFKGNRFLCGEKIKKYIKRAILESMPERIEIVSGRVDQIEELIETKADNERVDKLESDVKKLESEVKNLKHNVEGLTDIVLAALPPDTPIRRKIVEENIGNKKQCFELLQKEALETNQIN